MRCSCGIGALHVASKTGVVPSSVSPPSGKIASTATRAPSSPIKAARCTVRGACLLVKAPQNLRKIPHMACRRKHCLAPRFNDATPMSSAQTSRCARLCARARPAGTGKERCARQKRAHRRRLSTRRLRSSQVPGVSTMNVYMAPNSHARWILRVTFLGRPAMLKFSTGVTSGQRASPRLSCPRVTHTIGVPAARFMLAG